ncbi:MAG: hypothetical protein RQ751_02380 [Longimicrobiales bacterium]|nr:hypothetical protein [Longimicrobiales bacterium]
MPTLNNVGMPEDQDPPRRPGPTPPQEAAAAAHRALPRDFGSVTALVRRELARPVPDATVALVAHLRERFGDALAGVLLYGSCLRSGDLRDGLVDLYVVVDSFSRAYRSRALRLGNRLLPPNVFYLEIPLESDSRSGRGDILRSKYAVVSMAQLRRGCASWFHPYLWARFAQPARLAYARDADAEKDVVDAVAAAPVRFLAETHPLLADEEPFPATELWRAGLARSYAAELRPERNRAETLVALNHEYLESLTRAAQPALPELEPAPGGRYRSRAGARGRRRARRRWGLRRLQGRLLSVLRLTKAATTFENGLDYLAWKVARHTGERIDVTPELRRRPLLRGFRLLRSLLRRGTIR